MNLYELTDDILVIQNLLESDEYDEQTLADTLEAIEGAYEYKLESYAKVIKNIEADINAIKTEVTRLTDKRKTLENRVDRLKSTMFESMKTTGKTKVKGDIFTVAIQKNGGKAPVIVDVTTADLPDELVRITEAPDIEAIRDYLDKVGESKLAHYGERGESLRIK